MMTVTVRYWENRLPAKLILMYIYDIIIPSGVAGV